VVNALGQVDTVVDSRAGATSYSNDAIGRTASVMRPNGVQSIYGYTDRGLLGSLRHVRGADEVAAFAYTFDASGLRTGAGETFGGVTNPVSWTHDLNQRLTDETRAGATQSWGYDAVSNRTSQTAGGTSIAGVFDNRDRLTSLGNASYTWDIAGRLRSRTVSGATTSYTWTDDDRLTRVDLPSGGSVRYGYDAQGLMVSRTDAAGTTGFVWDGALPYGQVVATTSASGTLDSRWVYGSDRLAEIHGDTVLWLLTDGLGNVRAVTDSVGGVVGRQDFDAWGNRTVDSGRTSAFGYRGEWADKATGLVYLRARWMDPSAGRFVSEDPYWGKTEEPNSLHRFLYANSGPMNAMDPTGKYSLMEFAAVNAALDGLILSVTVPREWIYKIGGGSTDRFEISQGLGYSATAGVVNGGLIAFEIRELDPSSGKKMSRPKRHAYYLMAMYGFGLNAGVSLWPTNTEFQTDGNRRLADFSGIGNMFAAQLGYSQKFGIPNWGVDVGAAYAIFVLGDYTEIPASLDKFLGYGQGKGPLSFSAFMDFGWIQKISESPI